MPFWQNFLHTISRILPPDSIAGKEALIAELNPDKIYIENVRSIFNVSHDNAKRICETAVRQGIFLRAVEVACPDGAVAASADTEDKLPQTVHCWVDDGGHLEEVELPTASLKKTVVYRLNDNSDSIPYGQTA
jgi:hypothetical protein